MIDVHCRKVEKKEKGKMKVFARHTLWTGRKNVTRRKIPKNAVYYTHSGHWPRVARGCGPDNIDNYVYWDKELNPVLDVRIEDNMTWHSAKSVPKNVITLHKKALVNWLEGLKNGI